MNVYLACCYHSICLSIIYFHLNLSNYNSWIFGMFQVFMLRRASEEPRGHAAAIMTEVLADAECKGVINASQKKLLMQQLALNLS